jgi:SAM-dependent methyltransferase
MLFEIPVPNRGPDMLDIFNRRTNTTKWSNLSDEQWLATLISSLNGGEPNLPGFPSEYLQSVVVGSNGEAAIRQAFTFFNFTKEATGQIGKNFKLLDFGVGWGRTLRTWMRDIPTANLYGVDIDPNILMESKAANVPGDLRQIDPLGDLPFQIEFDIIISFSVFSHLSEESARHWLPRLSRTLRPGGTMVVTVLGRHFLDMCAACAEKPLKENDWETMLGALFSDPSKAIGDYNKGRYVYAPVGGYNDSLAPANYGWAAMPLGIVEREIGSMVRDISLHQDPGFGQDAIVIKK